MSRGRTALRWLPAIAWAALIFGLSSIPDLRVAQEPVLDLVVRKAGHAGVYAVLAALVHAALPDRPRRPAVALAVTVAYAATDELHQAFVPGRGPSPFDVAVDALGAGAGLLFVARAGFIARARSRAAALWHGDMGRGGRRA